ncbi:kinase-like domain-containing protein [Apiospora saccharicola]|uniref:Kinase-like domain-containing protein n=1 Tax=Apiospora saccharicola TaxID=335842 RepID=A0ABR1UXW3_9PEZI
MENSATDFVRVLAAIRNTDLRYPDEELLESFLEDSIDSEYAARYALQTCSATRGGGLDLTPLLSDWKRLIAAVKFYKWPSSGRLTLMNRSFSRGSFPRPA